jgi:hypothetical protein
MAYTDFNLETVVSRFSLILDTAPLFTGVNPVEVPPTLTERLAEGQELALSSEKARSEFIVAPILLALRRLAHNRIAVYSGQRFDVDTEQGLAGECDFILSATKPVPIVQAPIISVVEAKRGELQGGYGQCAAQMLASLRFNQHANPSWTVVYGCITTGEVWQFARLRGDTLTFDTSRLLLDNLGLILGTFLTILNEVAPAPTDT